MLERLALPSAFAPGRLTVPGVSRDPRGVALGPRGLLLFTSMDRALRWLTLASRDGLLVELATSLEVVEVQSRLGLREVAVTFDVEATSGMDRAAGAAKLLGGFAFTGALRHFVQYRDGAAPYGYDAAELLLTEASWVLYHQAFSQTYDVTRTVPLRALLSRMVLEPSQGEGAKADDGSSASPILVVTEEGLGPTLARYLHRSGVKGDVMLAEWPPESALSQAKVRRYVIRAELPARMRGPLEKTPGFTLFAAAGAGVAVEVGYQHPIALAALPVFGDGGLTLFRAGAGGPWVLPRFEASAPLRAFAPIALRRDPDAATVESLDLPSLSELRTPLNVVLRSGGHRAKIAAVWMRREKLSLLRRLAYALPGAALEGLRIAAGARGIVLRGSNDEGAEGLLAIPLGTSFHEPHPSLFLPFAFELTPAVSLATAAEALGVADGRVCFVTPKGRALLVAEAAFVPLVSALLAPTPGSASAGAEPLAFEPLARAFDEARIDLRVAPLGAFPLRNLATPGDDVDA